MYTRFRVKVSEALSDHCHDRHGKDTDFVHLLQVSPKQLCALSHLGCNREVGTSYRVLNKEKKKEKSKKTTP